MSTPGSSRPRNAPSADNQPLRGGLIGIALVALATLGMTAVAAVVVALILLIAG